MQLSADSLSVFVSVLALVTSVLFFIINWRHTQTLFQQGVISELDISLGDGTWKMGEPLLLKVTNLGEASVEDVIIQLHVFIHDSEPLRSHLQPFSILGNKSDNSIHTIDVSNYVTSQLLESGIVKRVDENALGVELVIRDLMLQVVVRIDGMWQSGVYGVHKQRSMVVLYSLMVWEESETPPQWRVDRYHRERFGRKRRN